MYYAFTIGFAVREQICTFPDPFLREVYGLNKEIYFRVAIGWAFYALPRVNPELTQCMETSLTQTHTQRQTRIRRHSLMPTCIRAVLEITLGLGGSRASFPSSILHPQDKEIVDAIDRQLQRFCVQRVTSLVGERGGSLWRCPRDVVLATTLGPTS